MRFAIPITGDRLEEHFGHCEKFAFIDVDPATKQITGSEQIEAPEHQPGLLPPWLQQRGVTHVIAGNMGERAQSLFQAASIDVIIGAPIEGASTLVRQFLDATLVTKENTCHH